MKHSITPAGKTEFQTLLHQQFEKEGSVSSTLYGALLFLHLSDLQTVEELLERRLVRLDELIEKLGPIRKQLLPLISTGGEHLLTHIEKQRCMDREWLAALLADVKARRVRDVSDPKSLGTAGQATQRNRASITRKRVKK